MASFNKIIVVGHLGRDPELRYTSDGTAVCNFSVATSERRKDRNGEMQETTTWFRVSDASQRVLGCVTVQFTPPNQSSSTTEIPDVSVSQFASCPDWRDDP